MPGREIPAGAMDDVDAVTRAVLTASRLLVAVSARSPAEVEERVTLPQFRMLVVLSTRGATKLVALADLLQVAPSTAMRMVDRLIAAGLADRHTNPGNRRRRSCGSPTRGGAPSRTSPPGGAPNSPRSSSASHLGNGPCSSRRSPPSTKPGESPSPRHWTTPKHIPWAGRWAPRSHATPETDQPAAGDGAGDGAAVLMFRSGRGLRTSIGDPGCGGGGVSSSLGSFGGFVCWKLTFS